MEITGFVAGGYIIAYTIIISCFLLMISYIVDKRWFYKILTYVFFGGVALGLLTLLVSLFMNVTWCSC
jgi:hypothetical protein